MNFIFEDEFDFKKELQEPEETCATCLITGNPITDICTLKCNHSYNYDSIFTEVYNQKINPKFKNDTPLKNDQIKCPYCRKRQRGLLPERQKIFRITTIDKDYEVDPNIVPTIEILRQFKEEKCSVPLCNKKQVIFLKRLNEFVCCFHFKIPKTKLVREIKLHNHLLKYPDIEYTHHDALWEHIQKEEDIAKHEKEQAKIMTKHEKEQAKIMTKHEKEQAKIMAKHEKEQAKIMAKQEKEQAKIMAKQEKEANQKKLHI